MKGAVSPAPRVWTTLPGECGANAFLPFEVRVSSPPGTTFLARRVHINTAPGDLCWVSGSNEMAHDPPIPCQGADRPIARFVLRVSSMATLKACEVTARVAFAEGEELSIVHHLQVREMRGCCG